MKHISIFASILIAGLLISCQMGSSEKEVEQVKVNEEKTVRLVTLDPGHFHAALVQKSMYPEVDSVVHVYAPAGSDVQLHLERIEGYNKRADQPTRWKEEVYTGDDYFQKMLEEKKGNV